MKKTIPLVLVAIAVLLIVGFVFNPFSKTKETQDPDTPAGMFMDDSDGSDESFSGKMTDLLKLGKNMTCKFETSTEGQTIKGTVHVSGKNVRSEYEISSQNAEFNMEGFALIKDNTLYTWTSAQEQGFKMVLPEDSQDDFDPSTSFEDYDSLYNNLDTDFDYSCKPWVLDKSVFDVPSDIEFLSFAEQLEMQQEEAFLEGMEQYDVDSLCSACESASDPTAVAQCKQAIGCN